MSRLHDPGPGEILDRLTILALKALYGKQAGRDTTEWVRETEALGKQISPDLSTRVLLQLLDLAAVNAALWQAEDDIRRYRTEGVQHRDGVTFHAEVGRCAMQIQALNDRRAELITLININTGIERPSDKV